MVLLGQSVGQNSRHSDLSLRASGTGTTDGSWLKKIGIKIYKNQVYNKKLTDGGQDSTCLWNIDQSNHNMVLQELE